MPTREASLVAMDVREFKTFRELIHRRPVSGCAMVSRQCWPAVSPNGFVTTA